MGASWALCDRGVEAELAVTTCCLPLRVFSFSGGRRSCSLPSISSHSSSDRLAAEVNEMQDRLDVARIRWQEEERALKKALQDKTSALKCALASRSVAALAAPVSVDGGKWSFKGSIRFEERDQPIELLLQAVALQAGGAIFSSELRRHAYLHDSQFNVLPIFADLPKEASAYPVVAKFKSAQVAVADPRMRGILIDDLMSFFDGEVGETICESVGDLKPACLPTKLARLCNRFNLRNRGRTRFELTTNLYAVEALLIRPMTEASRLSLSEVWRPHGCLIEVFISHCWVEDFGEFCQSTYRYALHRALKSMPGLPMCEVVQRARDMCVYVCAFSNNQWNLQAELGHTIEDTPFYKVLKADTTASVVLNMDQMGALLFRAWCNFEFFHSTMLNKDVVLNTRFGPLREISADKDSGKFIQVWIVHIFDLLQDVDIRFAQASCEEDLVMIQQRISCFIGTGCAAGLQGADALNRLLKSMIATRSLTLLAQVGSVPGLELALDCGANADAADDRHIRALTYAVALHGPQSAAAKVLLDRGADPRAAEAASTVVAMFGDCAKMRKQAIKQVLSLSSQQREFHLSAARMAQEEHALKVRAALELLALNSWAAAAEAQDSQDDTTGAPLEIEAANNLTADAVACVVEAAARVVEEASVCVTDNAPSGSHRMCFDSVQGVQSSVPLASPCHPESMATCVAALLNTHDEDERRAAVEVLGDLGEAAAAHAPGVAGCLDDEDDGVRCAALVALGRLGDAAAPHVEGIAACLTDYDADVRKAACEALANIGDAADHHAEALAGTLTDNCSQVRRAAVEALGQLGAEVVTQHAEMIADCLEDAEIGVRCAALGTLAQLGENASKHAEAVLECLGDSDWHVRQAAVDVLGVMGDGAAGLTHVIAETLHDKDCDVRKAGCQAFITTCEQSEAVTIAATSHLPAILECLDDGCEEVREAANDALAQIRGRTPPGTTVPSVSNRSFPAVKKTPKDSRSTAGMAAAVIGVTARSPTSPSSRASTGVAGKVARRLWARRRSRTLCEFSKSSSGSSIPELDACSRPPVASAG